MTSSPPAGKVNVREIPVKSPAIEKEVFESGREEGEMEWVDEEGGREVRWEGEKEKEVKWNGREQEICVKVKKLNCMDMRAHLQQCQQRCWYPRWRGFHFVLSFAQPMSQSHRLHSQYSLLGKTQSPPLWREEEWYDAKGIIQLWITLNITSKFTTDTFTYMHT